MGLHTMLEGDDAKLEGVPRIAKASSVTTQELLSRFFPSDSGFVPDKCTIMDMGAGFGGTARVAAKELGCKVRRETRLLCSLLSSPFGCFFTHGKRCTLGSTKYRHPDPTTRAGTHKNPPF